jgi:hypothetical protein
MLIQEGENDVPPLGMVDRADVIDTRGNPDPVGSRMRVDDTSNDRLGHSLIVSIHDRQERRMDAGRRGHGVDCVGIESSQPLRAQDGESDKGYPRGETVKKPCVVCNGVSVAVVRRLSNDRADVGAVGGREKHGDGSHGMAHEHEAVVRQSLG